MLVLLVFVVINISCVATINKKDRLDQLFNLVLEDYYLNNPEDLQKYSLFGIRDVSLESNTYYHFIILPISENSYNYVLDVDDSNSYLPFNYRKYNEVTFFFVKESKINKSNEMLLFLDSLNQLDSTRVKRQLGLVDKAPPIMDVTDDLLQGVDYFICKDNPNVIKKTIKTSAYIRPDDPKFKNICD